MPDSNSNNNFTSIEAKASYGVGLQMGQQLQGAFDNVSINEVLLGVQDAFEGKEPQVNPDDINAAFQEIQQQHQAKQAENAGQFAAEGETFLSENAKREEVTVIESGLQYEILETGDGDKPNANDVVRTHYRGTLINGKEFDSSYSRNEPTEFPVNGVIAGWTEALQLMPAGSKWKLYIPHHLAYGERGAGGDIAPYQALIFELELLAIV